MLRAAATIMIEIPAAIIAYSIDVAPLVFARKALKIFMSPPYPAKEIARHRMHIVNAARSSHCNLAAPRSIFIRGPLLPVAKKSFSTAVYSFRGKGGLALLT
jgi:hypothetical protein